MLHYLDTVNGKAGGYYFDKIRINTYYKPRELRKLFPKELFEGETKFFTIRKAPETARRWGLRSFIYVVAPSMNCLELLALGLRYDRIYLSEIEITQDILAESKRSAAEGAYELIETTRKKFTSEHFIYQWTISDKTKNYLNDPNLFGIMTGYFGRENHQYAIYPRNSKITGQPCIHSEWRIRGASLIKKKTGIRSILDLIRFNIPTFFEKQEDKYLVREKIDRNKLGKWLLGWKGRRVFSRRQRMRIGLMSVTYLNVYDIRTYADLVHFIRMKKKQNISERRGRKTKWQHKYLALRDYGKFGILV
jgi:hypothetical protein